MQGIGLRPKIHVSADGSGVVGHAGARLLADLADATGLTAAYSSALKPLRPRGTGHDPGRITADLAVMLADGGEAIADLAVLRDQTRVFGPVASTPTAWRLLADMDEAALASLRAARASAREVTWLQAAETGEGIPTVTAAGRELPGLVLDLDATLVTCHSEKEQAAPTYKGGFGFHPLLWETPTTAPGPRHVQAPRPRRPPNSGPSSTPHRLNRNGEDRGAKNFQGRGDVQGRGDLQGRGERRNLLASGFWLLGHVEPRSLCAFKGRGELRDQPQPTRTRQRAALPAPGRSPTPA